MAHLADRWTGRFTVRPGLEAARTDTLPHWWPVNDDRSERSDRLPRHSLGVGGDGPEISAAPIATGMSAHRFYVASAGIEHDVLHLAEDATVEWHRFLSSQGLIS